MNIQDIKVGGKYVPHSKTVEGFAQLDECNHWEDAKHNNQPFLYCVGIEGNKVVLNSRWADDGRGNYYYPSDLTPYEESNNNTNIEQFKVDAEFIREAHAAACSEWKEKLKKKFPEAFKKSAFEFKREEELTLHSNRNLPLFIGGVFAPDGKEMKCLIVKSGYEMKVSEYNGRQILEFFEK